MGRRPRLPHSLTDRTIFRLGAHRFQPRVRPSNATGPDPATKPQNLLHPVALFLEHQQYILHHSDHFVYGGYKVYSPIPSKMYRKIRGARYVNPSILRNIPQAAACMHSHAANKSKVEPSARRLFCSKSLRLFSSSGGGITRLESLKAHLSKHVLASRSE